MVNDVGISILREVSEKSVCDINELFKQLTESPCHHNQESLKKLLEQPNFTLAIAINAESRIVGMATLMVNRTLLRMTGFIEDVVVDQSCRGSKLGERLMEFLLFIARGKRAVYVSLTSNPKREAANNLYRKLGFELIGNISESNYYRLYL